MGIIAFFGRGGFTMLYADELYFYDKITLPQYQPYLNRYLNWGAEDV